jgi:hypothetical protein
MTKQRVQQLTEIMARVLHYQDSGEPDWSTMDYAATKHEHDSLPEPIIKRYRNDAKFHAQVHRAVSMLLELDRASPEPTGELEALRKERYRLRSALGAIIGLFHDQEHEAKNIARRVLGSTVENQPGAGT